jgi:deoxyribose-phosphate aldolase
MKKTDAYSIIKMIDHSLLRPDATEADISRLCEEAVQYGFFSVCIHPSFIRKAKEVLSPSKIKISAVIGFPFGGTLPHVKQYESIEAVVNGADELDIVMNIALAKSGRWDAVERELADVVTITPGAVHKIIIETCYLTDDEKRKAALMVMNTGAKFIKTSTGFGPGNATVRDVRLIKDIINNKADIKAAGGIQTLKDAMAYVNSGASRIGTSSGVTIAKEVLVNKT